eukprot:g43545.t1
MPRLNLYPGQLEDIAACETRTRPPCQDLTFTLVAGIPISHQRSPVLQEIAVLGDYPTRLAGLYHHSGLLEAILLLGLGWEKMPSAEVTKR